VAATFSVANPQNTQDETRLALTVSVLGRGSLNIDPYRDTGDKSYRAGHWYADKAPGLSLLALPATAAVWGADEALGHRGTRVWDGFWSLQVLRLLVNGTLLALLCLALGRVAEGLRPGTGALVAVVAGLGSLLGPLASVLFEHDGSALLAFGAFLLAWDRRYVLAGAAAGGAVLLGYDSALAVVLVGGYVLLHGARALGRYVLGGVPAGVVLGLYDLLAFGSPFHLSYRYVVGVSAPFQRQGLFGLHVPSVADVHGVLLGGHGFHVTTGVLVTTPAALAAAAGLVLLWRQGLRTEAGLCAAVALAYLLFDAGYWAPYGGLSPGPRFLATGIPFLLVGLAPALARSRVTLLLALASIAVATVDALSWQLGGGLDLAWVPGTVWARAGLGRDAGVVLVFALAAAATAAALARPGALPRRVGLPGSGAP
jgi:hypothetical protein